MSNLAERIGKIGEQLEPMAPSKEHAKMAVQLHGQLRTIMKEIEALPGGPEKASLSVYAQETAVQLLARGFGFTEENVRNARKGVQ